MEVIRLGRMSCLVVPIPQVTKEQGEGGFDKSDTINVMLFVKASVY